MAKTVKELPGTTKPENEIIDIPKKVIPRENTKKYIKDLSMTDLVAYETACRYICTHYDQELKLNEVETWNYTKDEMMEVRKKYDNFTAMHRRIREIIENKINELNGYEGW